MEGLLLALFLLFSVVTALLERRKRRQQQVEEVETRQQQHRERMGTAPAESEEEEEDEELGGWPFPSGGDPFEQPQPARRPAPTDSMPPATEDARTLLADTERQARAAEKRAQAQEAEARQRARQAREVRPARRVAALIGQRRPAARTRDARSRRAGGRYHLTPEKAREAVVYAELLSPCKAEREEEWRW